jgi:hypothetical protein
MACLDAHLYEIEYINFTDYIPNLTSVKDNLKMYN